MSVTSTPPTTTPPTEEILTRNYKYRLKPTPAQVAAIERAMGSSRRIWNTCIRAQRDAMAAVRHGRKERVVDQLRQRYRTKRLVGMLAAKVKRFMAEKGLSETKARDLIAMEQAVKQAKYRRSLASQAALEAGAASMKHHWPDGVSTMVGWGSLSIFQDAASRWSKGDFGQLRFKSSKDPAALRWQMTIDWTLGKKVRLAALGQACEAIPCIDHRPLPPKAKVKQLSVTRNALDQYHVIVAIDVPRSSIQREYGEKSGKVAGVNPGIRLRLTVADKNSPAEKPRVTVLERPSHRMDRQDRKKARLLRKLDRQIRANNPECFDDKGRWKKGARAKVRSVGMQAARLKASEIDHHASEVRRDYYHKAAIRILKEYETVRFGNWKPADTREKKNKNNPPGAAIRRKATNRKVYRQAISLFQGVLKDKASLSRTERTVEAVSEQDTTRTCPVCKLINKELTLDSRKWTCERCNTSFVREHAAAWNLAQISAPEANTGQPRRTKVRRKPGSQSEATQKNEGVQPS
jgi:transposase